MCREKEGLGLAESWESQRGGDSPRKGEDRDCLGQGTQGKWE